AGRVLILVPSLDLLAQTEAAWREGGRRGPMFGVSSLRGEEAVFPNTTDVGELLEWTRGLDKVTVYATYASLGLGTLERAHAAGLAAWDLIVGRRGAPDVGADREAMGSRARQPEDPVLAPVVHDGHPAVVAARGRGRGRRAR
ncbi:putative helicase, partial [Streptomyces sp. B1I3]|nr:putative helicase [Streptomyces sp. B1I3]